ncbi:Phosphate regulon sensor protein PhoR (SphS) [Arcticibacter svalbardensis MN12-7]|uniref:histidine kinase n=1 Tax=Arcticibacter svalbardensis MN12-7 TaxID=1150600 RepID=R9GLB6_9SPHI|nr:HAMP domain-containing sensor histidine kinase [Arcticibacter svalbardensis]EOR92508.1 Phosphate regulon sensor protein PhoR (SphS) [Arcticibacter svalbardensis MN12-7]
MRKSLIIFYALIIYALAELIWWGVLLIEVQPERQTMILGEGAVFIFLFFTGAYHLHKTLNKERMLKEQQKNFLLSVTHELKSPLASIKLYIQTILKRNLDKEQIHSFLNNSLKDIERLDDLVENMLLATRIENHSYSFPKEKFNLTEVIRSVASRLQIHTCSSQIIKLNVEPDIYITGDRFALTLVVSNLIENAVKYSPPCEEIAVELKRTPLEVSFTVADKGIGIKDEEKFRIFEKFYRVGSEDTRKTKGTGLGLYIVKQVLDKHLAFIKVKNNRPAGSIFEVTFNTDGH